MSGRGTTRSVAGTVKTLTVVVVALTCLAVGIDAASVAEKSTLGNSRLVDLRYELNVKLPTGFLPCELTPGTPGVVHAVERAVFEAVNSDVAPLPARSDVFLSCVCEGSFCDEKCEAWFPRPIKAQLGAARTGSQAGRAQKADADADRSEDFAAYENPSGDSTASLGQPRFYTLWEKCSMNNTFYESNDSVCSGLTANDGVYELEHKCRRPGFQQMYAPQCPHPSGGSVTEPEPALTDPVSDLNDCQAKCARTNHCCNSDPKQGSNQHLSCLQACMVVKSGVSGDECLIRCPTRKCAYEINGVTYPACQTCDDVPAHKARFGEKFVGVSYECTAVYGADEESCEAGCAAGAGGTAEASIPSVVEMSGDSASDTLDGSDSDVDDSENGHSDADTSDGSDSDTAGSDADADIDTDNTSDPATDLAIEQWYNGHAVVGCMPVVPTGQPKYVVLWEKCHTNWMFHKRNAERCEALSESDGCVELEKHCARLKFAEEFHDQCQDLYLNKHLTENVETIVDQRVRSIVEGKLAEAGLLDDSESHDDGTNHRSAQHIATALQLAILEKKLNEVIANMTSGGGHSSGTTAACDETCVGAIVDKAFAEHVREFLPAEETAEETAADAETKTHTAELARDALLRDIGGDETTHAKAKLLADAAIAGVNVTKLAMTLTATTEHAACVSAFSKMKIDPSLGACDAAVSTRTRRRLASADTAYDVTVLVSPTTVDAAALATALGNLAVAGVASTSTTTDPAQELRLIPGISTAGVSGFAADAVVAAQATGKAAMEQESTTETPAGETPAAPSPRASYVALGPAPSPMVSFVPPAETTESAFTDDSSVAEEALLATISDPHAKNEAKILADSVIAGEETPKVTMVVESDSEENACPAAAALLGNPEGVVCDVAPGGLGSRPGTYVVEILVNPTVVHPAQMSGFAQAARAKRVSFQVTKIEPKTKLEALTRVDRDAVLVFEEKISKAVPMLWPATMPITATDEATEVANTEVANTEVANTEVANTEVHTTEVVTTEPHADGSKTEVRADGGVTQVHADGSKTEVRADGSVTQVHADGSSTEVHADGSITEVHADEMSGFPVFTSLRTGTTETTTITPSLEPFCLSPEQAAAEEKFVFDELGDEQKCVNACATKQHCCNDDITQGSNQQLSCLQACMVVKSGVPKHECVAYCPFKSCSRWIRGVHYEACAYCDDVPEHAYHFETSESPEIGNLRKPSVNVYECSTELGTSTATCEDGCAAGDTDLVVFYPGEEPTLSAPRCSEASATESHPMPFTSGPTAGPSAAPGQDFAPPGSSFAPGPMSSPASFQDARTGLDEVSVGVSGNELLGTQLKKRQGRPLLGCSFSDARSLTADFQRTQDQFITLRFGITVPVAVRAETIHALRANDVLFQVARRLEQDDHFKTMWPGPVIASDFSLVDFENAASEGGDGSAGLSVDDTRIPALTQIGGGDAIEIDDPQSAANALILAKNALAQRRRSVSEAANEVSKKNAFRTVSGELVRAKLGASAGVGAENSGSSAGFFAAAVGLSALALAAVAAAAATKAPASSRAERAPLTGKGATQQR